MPNSVQVVMNSGAACESFEIIMKYVERLSTERELIERGLSLLEKAAV